MSVQIIATPTNAPCSSSTSFVFQNPYSSSQIAASPNPASSELIVTSTASDEQVTKTRNMSPQNAVEAELYDNHGSKVKTAFLNQGKVSLNVSELPNGLYNLRVKTSDGYHVEHIQVAH